MKPAFSDPYDRYCQDTLFFENNQGYLKGLYQQYQQDPSTLSPDWQTWFAHFPLDDVAQEHFCFTTRPSPKNLSFSAVSHKQELQATLAAERLINAYRQWGHRLARLDPLGLQNFSRLPFLNPAIYGLQPHQQVFALNESLSVTDLITRLHYIYGQTLGLEFMHIDNQEEQVWLQQRFEHRTLNFSNTQRLKFYEYLVKTEKFEQFLHTKFPGAKRFSIEGNDTLIPVLAYILENIPAYQTRHLTVGMAHRGRLAVLAHILEKPLPLIMADFQDHSSRKDFPGAGDVKYHQGYTCQKVFHNNLVTVTMMNNASHLESVTPIALGKTYYLQNHDLKKENALDDALAVLIHGDAAFSGQGVVAESLQLSKLAGYHVGGAIHFILNNQIGFSTPVHEARSTWYCSDIAKAFACPILHVNADDTEAVVWAVQLALDLSLIHI